MRGNQVQSESGTIELAHLNKRFLTAIAKNISSKMYQGVLIELDEEGLARTTIEGIDITAGMIFRYGVQEKYLKEDPTANAVIPKKMLTVNKSKMTQLSSLILRNMS